MATQPVLIIHGGAGSGFKTNARRLAVRRKLHRILRMAYEKLWITNSALEAVTYAVQLMEDDHAFNAGTGSLLQSDGHARLNASVMDGFCERFAAVINLEKIKNPVLVAKALLKEKDRVLASEGAYLFAKKLGMKPYDTRTREAINRWKRAKEGGFDTVGACALDWKGQMAAATSTGGRGLEHVGRVSDCAMPIANFADAHCAVSVTGIGEEIIDEGLAVKIATRVRDGLKLGAAFEKSFREVSRHKRRMGAIGLDAKGNLKWATTTDMLIYGWQKGKKYGMF